MKKKRFYRFDCIFEAQKHDCKKQIGCPEETSPYLRKPFPKEILYLNPLTHMYKQTVRHIQTSTNIDKHRQISRHANSYRHRVIPIGLTAAPAGGNNLIVIIMWIGCLDELISYDIVNPATTTSASASVDCHFIHTDLPLTCLSNSFI